MTKKFTLGIGALLASVAFTTVAQAQTALSMWYHGAGNEVEA